MPKNFEGGSDIPDGDYAEKRQFCYCFSLKCGVILVGILISVDLCIEIINLAFISLNVYFDTVYPVVYGLILIPLLVAAGFFIHYYASKDCP